MTISNNLYEQLFKSWYIYLKDFLNQEYFQKLFLFINESYKQKVIYPDKKNIFKALQQTNFSELRVVLIGDNPYQGNKATGLAFANEDNIRESTFSPLLLDVKDNIEQEIYNGLYLGFDPTLENWSKQGVLLLNKSLTVEANKPDSHTKYWNRFFREIITIINENKTGIIFCFMESENSELKKLINTNIHYIVDEEYPFKEINNIIEKNNGKSELIIW